MFPDFRVRQRDYLLEISQALTQELDLDALLNKILKFAIEMLAGHAGLIALRTEESGWQIRVSEGISPDFLDHMKPFLQQIPDDQDPEKFEVPEVNRILGEITFSATLGLLSGVGLPLITQKKVVGLIYIFRSYPGLFTANDRTLLHSFANQAAIAVQNAQLYRSVIRNKQRLDALFDSAADGILLITSNQVIEHCNPAFSRLVGQPSEEVIGKSHDQIVRLENTMQDVTLEKAIAGGWPLTPHAQLYVEGDLVRPSLPPLPIGITYAPMLSPENKLTNIIATFRDITNFRKADEAKTTFISIVSHELKTPVALIKGYVCTLNRKDVKWDSAFVDESLKIIEEEADHLNGLIENLLDATRLQTGKFSIQKTDISIPDIARRLVERFSTQTDKHTFKIDFPDDFPSVMADDTRIEQVLSNLISNAIKYSQKGEITIGGEARRDKVIVCVSDEGPGISQQDLPFIFDRFYRSPDAARKTKGTGLGLYLTQQIIEAHKGRIWIDTERNKGARFCFSLPRNE